MKYYRRKRYSDKRTKRIVLRVFFVIVAAVLIGFFAVLLGNHVKKMVEAAEEKIKSAETGENAVEPSPLRGQFSTDLPNERISVSAITVNPFAAEDLISYAETLKTVFDTVSVRITEGGRLIYPSPAMLSLARMPEEVSSESGNLEEYEKMRDFCAAWKGAGFRLCAVMEASTSGGALLSENDSVLCGELSALGFDEVIITGFENLETEQVMYLSRLASEEISVGVVYPAEEYSNEENERLIRQISAVRVFLCADFGGELIPSAELEEHMKNKYLSIRNSMNSYGIRVFIDSTDPVSISEEKTVFSGLLIENIHVARELPFSFIEEHFLRNNREPEETQDSTETEDPVNPYMVTETENSLGAPDSSS